MTSSKDFHRLSVFGFEQIVVNCVIAISEEHLGVITTPVIKSISSPNSQDSP
jgi:hypothetical protein